jgi:hypothetical protein
MTVAEFTLVLLAEMEADQSTAFVDCLLRDARAKIKAGKGSVGSVISGSENGKTFQREMHMTPLQVLQACRSALKQYLNNGENDDEVSSTRADFSRIDR